MVMPQLNVMLDNCLCVNSKSNSGQGRMQVGIAKNISLPRFPDSIKTNDFCVVNHVNWTGEKSKTSSSVKKRKTKSQTSTSGISDNTNNVAKNADWVHQTCNDDQCYKCMKLSIMFVSAFGNMDHHPKSCPRHEQFIKTRDMVPELLDTVDMEGYGKEEL